MTNDEMSRAKFAHDTSPMGFGLSEQELKDGAKWVAQRWKSALTFAALSALATAATAGVMWLSEVVATQQEYHAAEQERLAVDALRWTETRLRARYRGRSLSAWPG